MPKKTVGNHYNITINYLQMRSNKKPKKSHKRILIISSIIDDIKIIRKLYTMPADELKNEDIAKNLIKELIAAAWGICQFGAVLFFIHSLITLALNWNILILQQRILHLFCLPLMMILVGLCRVMRINAKQIDNKEFAMNYASILTGIIGIIVAIITL